MPELPEVEITRRGIEPHIAGRIIRHVDVRQPRLRWPVPATLPRKLSNAHIRGIDRRAKYLLIATSQGTVIVHLGMSGSLRVVPHTDRPGPYDHVDIVLDDGACLRLRDPRRFGCVLWAGHDPCAHPLLRNLGPEPLSAALTGDYLYRASRGRTAPVKAFVMDHRIVVGIGNIYANEALFASGILPGRRAGLISRARYQRLSEDIKHTLGDAIAAGGTTLRDFTDADGRPGYFRHRLRVYGQDGAPCPRCGQPIQRTVVAQRSSFFCRHCQR